LLYFPVRNPRASGEYDNTYNKRRQKYP
jgi:hypothetical protein